MSVRVCPAASSASTTAVKSRAPARARGAHLLHRRPVRGRRRSAAPPEESGVRAGRSRGLVIGLVRDAGWGSRLRCEPEDLLFQRADEDGRSAGHAEPLGAVQPMAFGARRLLERTLFAALGTAEPHRRSPSSRVPTDARQMRNRNGRTRLRLNRGPRTGVSATSRSVMVLWWPCRGSAMASGAELDQSFFHKQSGVSGVRPCLLGSQTIRCKTAGFTTHRL